MPASPLRVFAGVYVPSVDAVTMVTTFRYCVERAPMQPCHSGNTRFYINWALRCGNTSHCGERALGFVHRILLILVAYLHSETSLTYEMYEPSLLANLGYILGHRAD